jgi:hypothetical protein
MSLIPSWNIFKLCSSEGFSANGGIARRCRIAVKECGMEYSVDKDGKVLRAVKRGGKKGLTQESRVVVIKLDESNRVSAVEIKSEFTGS